MQHTKTEEFDVRERLKVLKKFDFMFFSSKTSLQ
jgi:hypothetical protein